MRSSFPSRRTSDALRAAARVTAAAVAVLAFAVAGCAAMPSAERRLSAEPDAAFAAADRAIGRHFSIVHRDAALRRLETEWLAVPSERTEGLVLDRPWHERVRVTAAITPAGAATCTVAVFVEAERKPAAGSRAYRFERTAPPEALAGELLDAIERSIERPSGAEEEVKP